MSKAVHMQIMENTSYLSSKLIKFIA